MTTKTPMYDAGASEMRELCAQLIERLLKDRVPIAGWPQLIRCLPLGGRLKDVPRATHYQTPFDMSDGQVRALEQQRLWKKEHKERKKT